MNKAVLFLTFNRFKYTKQVFEQIALAKPLRLYIASDGPRPSVDGEAEAIDKIRRYILANINWECVIHTLFRDNNLGCARGVSEAITWFFEHEEDGIVLEDDCLPTQSFFAYCEQMLDKYRHDSRIGIISGFNIKGEYKTADYDYFFSNLGGIWGWASWSRVWKTFDFTSIRLWQNDNFKELFKNHYGGYLYANRNPIYDALLENKIDTWDYYFGFCRALNNFLAIVPSKNLIKNIGFDNDATHTINHDDYVKNLFVYDDLIFPLRDNKIFIPDTVYDYFFIYRNDNYSCFQKTSLKSHFLFKFINKFKSFINK